MRREREESEKRERRERESCREKERKRERLRQTEKERETNRVLIPPTDSLTSNTLKDKGENDVLVPAHILSIKRFCLET